MPTLRLLTAADSPGHGGEVFACSFTPDGSHVLSAGWDGCLELWECASGEPVAAVSAGPKPLSACAVSPDSLHWYSGSMEGQLICWDAVARQPKWSLVAHARPISSILVSADGQSLVTSSWDRTLGLWKLNRDRERKPLAGHGDIVGGCRFLPDGDRVLSWSHDGTLRLWDLRTQQTVFKAEAHKDRVTAAAVSPTGRLAISASRDQTLKVWDLEEQQELLTQPTPGPEVVACLFLLDGESVVTVAADGRVQLLQTPELALLEEVTTDFALQCAELSPKGDRVALGGADGRVHTLLLDGFDTAPLFVPATQTTRQTKTMLQKMFGGRTVTKAFQMRCPVCGESFELTQAAPGQGAGCPSCRRMLRLSVVVPERN